MQNITIGRYSEGEAVATRIHCDAEGNEVSREQVQAHAGWIEGVRDDGTTWIMYMDAGGSPECFWPIRDESGAVSGDPVILSAR